MNSVCCEGFTLLQLEDGDKMVWPFLPLPPGELIGEGLLISGLSCGPRPKGL